MKLMILGGDGFCGWPASLYFSRKGHEILILDNFSRRKIDEELNTSSLTPILSLSARLKIWHDVSGMAIQSYNIDIAHEYDKFLFLLQSFRPDALLHFAEQRSVPYSMSDGKHRNYTIFNNVNATHNVLNAIVASGLDTHLIHLGSVGAYGYKPTGMLIPEGYVNAKIMDENGKEFFQKIMYPFKPGSIYHLSKCLDTTMFQYYGDNDNLRITDLCQGIVWGSQTNESSLAEGLINRFDYDGVYGTVLNRFLVQAAIGHPITVYGTGEKTAAFINIKDTLKCLEIALNFPPKTGEVIIRNQVTESFQILVLAEKVAGVTNAKIEMIDNPRKEPPRNDFKVSNTSFINNGLDPIVLDDKLMRAISDVIHKYKDRIDCEKIMFNPAKK